MSLETYTLLLPCSTIGGPSPPCPEGWESVGFQPGCSIGNAPGYGPLDVWKLAGKQRVCKKSILSTGDIAVDCCNNLDGVSASVECKAFGYEPHSTTCNNVMVDKCEPARRRKKPVYNGMPYGQTTDDCTKRMRTEPNQPIGRDIDPRRARGTCDDYLRHSPANSFFSTHDYDEYAYHFPRYSYTTPDFSGTFGYQPMRKPYRPYYEWEAKNGHP